MANAFMVSGLTKTYRGHLYVYLCKKAEECGYEKDFIGRG